MKDLLPENNKQKHQFRSYYCAGCKQQKPCQLLTGWDSVWKSYCCPCYYQTEQQRAKEYSSYEKVLASKQRERQEHIRQYQLLKNYSGCKQCGSLVVDAYSLYENSQLVCQPCLMRKEGGSSSPISFAEESKWYKKRWGINLNERLENFSQLPVNKNCAERCQPLAKQKWLKDKQHLNNCQCLEIEVRESYLLFANSFKETEEKLKECQCEISPKIRVSSDNWTWCEKCGGTIITASKKRVIKNRNDPRFWGLEIKEKVLCLNCLGKFTEKMPISKKYVLNKYLKRGYD